MPRSAKFAAFPILIILLVFGCLQPAIPPSDNSTAPPADNSTVPPSNGSSGIPNPASQFCVRHNGTLEIRAESSGQYGVCSFSSGAKCEEWAYYRGECSPEAPNFCDADSECACGVHRETRECFYGQGEFVDESWQCPDFCSGIAGHLKVVCESHQCVQARSDQPSAPMNCGDYPPDTCPQGCVVCPPCPACSSIRCSTEEYCDNIGFGADWYNSTRPD